MPSYQQGIQPPTSLGFRPTAWKEPETPAIKSVVWKSPSVGATRNYGSTPNEVDTMPHRWILPQQKAQSQRKKEEDEEEEGSATSPSSSRTMQRGKAAYDAFKTFRASRATP
jgi:hypothetical protein